MRAFLAGMLGLLAAFAMASSMALAAPADPAQRDAVLAVYQAWNKAVVAGKLDEAVALRTVAMRKRIAEDIKTAAQRKQVIAMLKSMVPQTVEVVHAKQNKDGSKLTLDTVISVVVPPGPARQGMPPPGTKLQAELALDFLREGGTWKFDNQTYGMDPTKIKPCTIKEFPGMAAFEERENASMGGQIRRVEFAADHTLIVIRVFDEENCIFLPSKARLIELGFNPDQLQPWAIIEIAAWPHRSDKQAVWAASLRMVESDD